MGDKQRVPTPLPLSESVRRERERTAARLVTKQAVGEVAERLVAAADMQERGLALDKHVQLMREAATDLAALKAENERLRAVDEMLRGWLSARGYSIRNDDSAEVLWSKLQDFARAALQESPADD